MLDILTQNWSNLAKFPPKNPAKSAVFVFPRNFPWNQPIFKEFASENPSKFDIFPRKSREISRFFYEFWLFSCKNTTNRPIFPRILTFFPRNRPIFSQICLWKSCEFCFFSTKIYQKPCDNDDRSVSSIDPTVIYKRIYLPSLRALNYHNVTCEYCKTIITM